ncbi:MAG TPA: TIGR02996 domain-containing protein [Kofleriaceae bacterium]
MAEQAALIAAIVADPNDRAAWQVYGDWLTERGDSRGEWIRTSPDKPLRGLRGHSIAQALSPRLLPYACCFQWQRVIADPAPFRQLELLVTDGGNQSRAAVQELQAALPATKVC